MINLSSIIPYYLEDESIQPLNIKASESLDIINITITRQINLWCNCTILSKDGRRLLQTNDKRYNYEVTVAINTIKTYCETEEEKDKYYEMLLKQHNANLEFEAINGFEYDPYSTTKKKSTTSRKKTKQTSLDFGDKPKKETAAEKKLKAHAAKISMLTFKIKPANGN
jgi:hypothetical protein